MLSAVVLTRNEERHVLDCIEALSFCDEIIVIDDYSDDRTVELLKNYKGKTSVKVFKRRLVDDFASQRNFGLEKAKGEWVLFVDVDERVNSLLREEILQLTKNPINKYNGVFIKRKDFMWGRFLNHGEAGNIKLLRLAMKNKGLWRGNVHEVWDIDGNIGELTLPLIHYPHPTVAEFLKEINRYSDLRAKELFKNKVHVHWWSIILYPKAKFFLNYFVKRGFLDGIPGLLAALIMSFHSFLVRSKLWFLWNK